MWTCVVAGVLSACPTPCSKDTCAGCCDSAGDCLGGALSNSCGLNGSSCRSCSSGQRCVRGECIVSVPDAVRVDAGPQCVCSGGCCSADFTCFPGNLPEACGIDAGLCAACQPSERCESGRCTALPCAGCLDATGVCRSGQEPFACGIRGTLCRACAATETCTFGSCTSMTCTPSSCRLGCCAGVFCQMPSETACGINGSACVSCASGSMCLNGQCQ